MTADRAATAVLICALFLAPSAAGCVPRSISSAGEAAPRRYFCPRAETPPVIDGRLDDAAWAGASWTQDFVDIEGAARPPPRLRTRVKMCHDDACFYVAAELEEPHVWATLTQRDAIIFHDNDFEVFIDPDGDQRNYYELEINALNTCWDLLLVRTYRDGGPPDHGWNIAGLRTAVHVDGTLNNPTDTDRGWSVEVALPWPALAQHALVPAPPRPGDEWRVNLSRVEWTVDVVNRRYVKRLGRREDNWVWSPQGVIDMHLPHRWGYVRFEGAPTRNGP